MAIVRKVPGQKKCLIQTLGISSFDTFGHRVKARSSFWRQSQFVILILDRSGFNGKQFPLFASLSSVRFRAGGTRIESRGWRRYLLFVIALKNAQLDLMAIKQQQQVCVPFRSASKPAHTITTIKSLLFKGEHTHTEQIIRSLVTA